MTKDECEVIAEAFREYRHLASREQVFGLFWRGWTGDTFPDATDEQSARVVNAVKELVSSVDDITAAERRSRMVAV
jgi:hypothetical protein